MNQFRSKLACVLAILSLAWLAPGCGHKQQLVSITIQPATETFGDSNTPVPDDQGLSVQLRAIGNYIHPPVSKDITDQVTWASNTPNIATVSASGLLVAAGIDCGNSLISATVQTNHSFDNVSSSGAIVTGSMTATVVCQGSSTRVVPSTTRAAGLWRPAHLLP